MDDFTHFCQVGAVTFSQGALKACTALKARIDAVKQKMDGTPTWQEIVMKCYNQGVDLSEKCL